MTIKAYCAACGEDCSDCYGTWMGEPYHIGCIPMKLPKRKRSIAAEIADDAAVDPADMQRPTTNFNFRR